MYQDGNHDWIGHVNGRRFRVPQATVEYQRQSQYIQWDQALNDKTEARYQAGQDVIRPAFWANLETGELYDNLAEWLDPPC
jgi:hypothetical protein